MGGGYGGLLCGMVHGAGKAMLMRGGACAAELRLMLVGVGSGCVGDCLIFYYVFVFVAFFCV
jgi:hypothetical protein